MSARLSGEAKISSREIEICVIFKSLTYLWPRAGSFAIPVAVLAWRVCRDKLLVRPAHSCFSAAGWLSCFGAPVRRGRFASLSDFISANNRFRKGKSLAGSSVDIKAGRAGCLSRTRNTTDSPELSLLRVALGYVTERNAISADPERSVVRHLVCQGNT